MLLCGFFAIAIDSSTPQPFNTSSTDYPVKYKARSRQAQMSPLLTTTTPPGAFAWISFGDNKIKQENN